MYFHTSLIINFQHIFSIQKYQVKHKELWDTFISTAKNSTFLFYRDFMDYHQDRFDDNSLLIFKNEKLIAVFPANREKDIVYSHQGLTYGSLVVPTKISSQDVFLIFDELCNHYRKNAINELYIKQIPEIYFKESAFEIGYSLAQKAELYRRDMILAIDYSKPLNIHKTKLKHYKKSGNYNFKIKCCDAFAPFWKNVLEPRLEERHNAKPVHSLQEIELLHKRFQDNIKQFNVYLDDEIVAGITLFETEQTVKSQYGATTKAGEKVRALDYLFLHLIYKYQHEGKRFFSMGTVVEDNDLGYNKGLLKQKEELGCSVYLQDFFKLKLYD